MSDVMSQNLLRQQVLKLEEYFSKEPMKIASIEPQDYLNVLKGLGKLLSKIKEDGKFTSLTDGITRIQYKNEVGLAHVINKEIGNPPIPEFFLHDNITTILRVYLLVLNAENDLTEMKTDDWTDVTGLIRSLELIRLGI